jgi:hypothetical protein
MVLGSSAAAFACGGLVAPNGTISLLRTTTLAAYHRGIEHYLTSFSYAGKVDGSLGAITPLPGVPTRVIKGGDWTLQRLEIEVAPPIAEDAVALAGASASAAPARVLLETTVDALDVTVLEGGAVAVGNWAREHGFFLPPDAPEVLDFYATRSPIFMATRFNAERAARQGLVPGQGIPVHVVIPTPNPWVPLRILTLGRQPGDLVQADVFLLTDREPTLLPAAGDSTARGLTLARSERASAALMTDLASDSRSHWIPRSPMWLSFLQVDARAGDLTYDLAIDASGYGHPDPVAAGFSLPALPPAPDGASSTAVLWFALALGLLAFAVRRRAAAIG